MSPPEFIVFHFHLERDSWEEVGRAHAVDAGAAFREVVLPPPSVARLPQPGEYRVLSLEGAAHIAIEFQLRDLEYEPGEQGGQR